MPVEYILMFCSIPLYSSCFTSCMCFVLTLLALRWTTLTKGCVDVQEEIDLLFEMNDFNADGQMSLDEVTSAMLQLRQRRKDGRSHA
jgi:hypothetical protein